MTTTPQMSIHQASGAAMDRRIERPHARRRKLIVRGGIVLAGAAAVIVFWLLLPGSGALSLGATSVRTGVVERAPFRDYVPLRAEVTPLNTVFMTAIPGGQVAQLSAVDGQMVAAGTPLARLTNPQLELDVATRSAGIVGQLSGIDGQRLTIQRNRLDGDQEVANARNALTKAEALLSQKQPLFEKGYITRPAIDPLREEVTYQRSRVTALGMGRSQADAMLADQSSGIAATARELRESLAMVRGSLAALTVHAPVAGRLTAFTLQPGQTLKPGDAVGQIDSEGRWKLTADVDQFYLGRVRTSQSATADVEGRGVRMTVLRVLPQVTEGRFRVELGFLGAAPAGLNRGQTLDVRLVLGADRPAIVAPSGGWLDAGGTSAFVLDGERRAVRRVIATGRRNPDQVEVTAGLSPGDRIVTSPLGAYAAYQTLLLQ